MADQCERGAWVEIRAEVLAAGERAPQIPDDTARVPLEMRCKGFVSAPAAPGDTVTIVTVTGRRVEGELVAVNPAYEHGFGAPVAALLSIGPELRALLGEAGSSS